MRDELLGTYERELTFLRQMGAEFAEKYPKIASRLLIEPDKCEDPHVERMIEAFAFLAARVRLKLDDEFPELTESLLNLLTPHFLAPIPSMSVVQFVLDPERVNLQTGQTIPKDSMLYSSPVGGMACRFRTRYPVTIWPIEVTNARFDIAPPGSPYAASARTTLRIDLRSFSGAPFSKLKEKISETEDRHLDHARFFLNGESRTVHGLYELLFNNVIGIELRSGSSRDAVPVALRKDAIRSVGFEPEEGLLPYSNRSFAGYRLLQELFTFPEKFFFFDLFGLDRVNEKDDTLQLRLYFDREFPLERNVNAQTFRLHSTPIVNLFKQMAEPIRLTRLQNEYRVIADVRRQNAVEVYSVDSVTSASPGAEKTVSYKPFYSFQHGVDRDQQKTFWYASRRPSERKDDEGTEIYMSLVDLGFNPSVPSVETMIVQTTCTNRDLPGRLPFGSAEGDFQLEGPGVYSSIRCLIKPTASRRTPLKRGVQWRLISHLALNYLSLVETDGAGPEALQEILKLYDYADSSVTRQQIAGITKIETKRVLRAVGVGQASFVRGLEIGLEFDEQFYIGSGVYLFATVLERFFGLYASVNSFSQLVVTTRQREGVLKRFPPRTGAQIIL